MPADKKTKSQRQTQRRKTKSQRRTRTRKTKSQRRTRKTRNGGGGVKTWAQNARNSYMIRLKYTLVPEGIQLDTRYIDTPYRFQSYQEARTYAKQLFPCYSYVVEGSRDPPTFTGSSLPLPAQKGGFSHLG